MNLKLMNFLGEKNSNYWTKWERVLLTEIVYDLLVTFTLLNVLINVKKSLELANLTISIIVLMMALIGQLWGLVRTLPFFRLKSLNSLEDKKVLRFYYLGMTLLLTGAIIRIPLILIKKNLLKKNQEFVLPDSTKVLFAPDYQAIKIKKPGFQIPQKRVINYWTNWENVFWSELMHGLNNLAFITALILVALKVLPDEKVLGIMFLVIITIGFLILMVFEILQSYCSLAFFKLKSHSSKINHLVLKIYSVAVYFPILGFFIRLPLIFIKKNLIKKAN